MSSRSIFCFLSFNSRPHKEVDTMKSDEVNRSEIFQFTTSQRGRLKGPVPWLHYYAFNSRPHKEVDRMQQVLLQQPILFQFTTSQRGRQGQKRQYKPVLRFQFTTSQRGRPGTEISCTGRLTFNSRPHKEVDQAAATEKGFMQSLSIHDLTKRSTKRWGCFRHSMIFQFTTSQRGRHGFETLQLHALFFQFTTSQRGRRKSLANQGDQ